MAGGRVKTGLGVYPLAASLRGSGELQHINIKPGHCWTNVLLLGFGGYPSLGTSAWKPVQFMGVSGHPQSEGIPSKRGHPPYGSTGGLLIRTNIFPPWHGVGLNRRGMIPKLRHTQTKHEAQKTGLPSCALSRYGLVLGNLPSWCVHSLKLSCMFGSFALLVLHRQCANVHEWSLPIAK